MEQLIERCAGLDVHKKTVAACVRTPGQDGQRQQHTRTFQTTTKGLLALRDWLASQQVRVVGMESTGAYWKAVYYRLETTMDCWLLNARHLRNVPGRKTDVADAAWIAQLVEHGLVRPSFVPPPPIRELRNLTRYRKTVIQERTREAQRLGEAAGGRRHQAIVRGHRHPGRLRPSHAASPGRRRARPPTAGRAGQGPPARQAPPTPTGPGRPLRPSSRAAGERDAPRASTPPTPPSIGSAPRSAASPPPTPRSWSCWRPFLGSTGAPPRSSWPRPAGTCASSPRRRTWPPGRGCARATTSRPASTTRAAPVRAPSGCAAPWWRPLTPPRAPRTPIWPPSTAGSAGAATTSAPRSPWPTRSW